ncbi:MAG: hypothetical protein AAGB12_09710 [Pseudomonadota bacterium]
MSTESLITTLKSLRLHGMASAMMDLQGQASPLIAPAQPLLDTLLMSNSM